MAGTSNIEWTDATWNPIVGCSIVSPGCTNCYAMKMAARIEKMSEALYDAGNVTPPAQYNGTTKIVNGNAVWTGKLALAPEHILLQPLKWKKPRRIFVNSMGDLFHEDAPDEWIDRVFAIMALCPQHTFQVLTKRADRMREYFAETPNRLPPGVRIWNAAVELDCRAHLSEGHPGYSVLLDAHKLTLPLPNVWLGVSAERQQEADERIPLLLQTAAAIRFVSCEPLLGPISIGPWLHDSDCDMQEHGSAGTCTCCEPREVSLDWIIAGGESGPNARPMHPDWARSLLDQCAAAGVPYFFKQWGNWYPEIDRDNDDPDWRQPYSDYSEPHFQILNLAGGHGFHGERVHVMRFCSKRSAGRLLDGREHNEFPAAAVSRKAAST